MAADGSATPATAGNPYTPDARAEPLWLMGLPPLPALADDPPARAEVVVVGSGYTGLCAALQTVRGGRETVVLEAGDPGQGCSTRNGGQISTSIKPSLGALMSKHGAERAAAIRDVGLQAFEWIERFLAEEDIACDFTRPGRFHAAHAPRAYDESVAEITRRAEDEGLVAHAVPREAQAREIGTEAYHGGVVFERYGQLHPGKYHRGLLRRVVKAGARVVPQCAATAIRPEGPGFRVATTRGEIAARNVVVATNGYTGALTPWLRRRVIPIGSYIVATEPVAPEVMDRLFPARRIVTDSRRVVYYYGPSPCGTRVVFGGRVSAGETDPWASGPRLKAELDRLFPELASVRVSHTWMGTVAYTFDQLPHTGCHEGVHYAMGYCGSGVSMSGYLGTRLGQRVLGVAEGHTALDDLAFPTRPLYTGRPWFLSAAVSWYRMRDGLESRLALG